MRRILGEEGGAVLARLATTARGPIAITARAARARFDSPVSMRISASLTTTQSTSAIAASSESLAMSIQRFIESRPLKPARALGADLALQVGLDVGEEEGVGRLRGVGELRLELAEDAELGVVGVGDVEVEVVVAAPEEALAAGDPLDVVGA